ncbi:MaoC/PaaZ C-terminal domain-containing protein [Micromonospora sp. NPDC023956]|uniref:MaoC/PaaZ C-terminal domain-containing protein n=1 Tax=Micromonospora sp. NPDC023956 TaxID=3155722 RepID=UPI0033FBBD36
MNAEPVRSGTGADAELFFEDLTPGRWFDLGVLTVDGNEMVAFARRFDPQWYHVDEELARQSHHGGLIASGFYTVSLFMRAYVDHVLSRAAADASPGLEELRWLAPVRAGDRLAVRLDVMGSKPSTARPGLGTVTLSGTMLRLDAEGRPECEVLRTRFRGWFTLRVQDEPEDVTEPDRAAGGDGPLRSDPVEVPAGSGPTPGTDPESDAGPAPGPHPATVAAGRTEPVPAPATGPIPVPMADTGPLPVVTTRPVPVADTGPLPVVNGGPSGPPAVVPVAAPPTAGTPVSAPPAAGTPVSAPPAGTPVSAPPARPPAQAAAAHPVVAPVSSLDAPTAFLPGPVVSAPPAPTSPAPVGPMNPYGLDAPTAFIPAARDPHDQSEPPYRHHPPEDA